MSFNFELNITVMCMNCNVPIGHRMVLSPKNKGSEYIFHSWKHLVCPHCQSVVWIKLDHKRNV